ncbi:MAG: exopolysaccharide biosynthesis polyprenyl glycosylphosphotransferase, partial [Gammaproteobacteria bacterium]
GKIRLDTLHPSNVIFADGFTQAVIKLTEKRILDILASLLLLLGTLPVMLVTAVAIFLESGGPVLYRQERVGHRGKLFMLYKFRSMRQDAEAGGAVWARQNDTRVTRVGAFIRKTRIDELPQLLNVLKGDMSFVGPRPERPEFVTELARAIPYYELRHYVKPGITGWAQILYPYGASINDAREKLQYDLYYLKNYSIFLDINILLQTVQVILWGKGAR